MDSDENKQNLDLKNEENKANQDPEKKQSSEESESKSVTDSNADNNSSAEQKPQGKNSSKIPVKIIVPAVIVIVAVIIIAVFLIHPASKAVAVTTVSYTPINYLSNSGLNSAIGGNWSLILNETANSTVINEYAGTGDFPPGTVAAEIQEFVPSSEVSQLSANKSANISDFVSTVYYMNSSSAASSIFDEIESITGSEYANNSKVNYNLSAIGTAGMVYINGRLNSSNSSTENATELYMIDGSSVVIATAANENIGYSQAKNIVSYLFS